MHNRAMRYSSSSVRRAREYDRCVRCGRAVPWGRSTCRDCNPAGLPSPSPSQYHATVFLAVLAVMAVLGVLVLLRG
jgi:hypothetical protein